MAFLLQLSTGCSKTKLAHYDQGNMFQGKPEVLLQPDLCINHYK